MFQKLVAFMKQNYSKFEIADFEATAEKATEEEQQIVNKEVKHRVLNLIVRLWVPSSSNCLKYEFIDRYP